MADDDALHVIATDPYSLAVARRGSLYPDHVVFLGPGIVQTEGAETAADAARRANPGANAPIAKKERPKLLDPNVPEAFGSAEYPSLKLPRLNNERAYQLLNPNETKDAKAALKAANDVRVRALLEAFEIGALSIDDLAGKLSYRV
jgi:hypothetical protein